MKTSETINFVQGDTKTEALDVFVMKLPINNCYLVRIKDMTRIFKTQARAIKRMQKMGYNLSFKD